ncbi:dynamin family protein [Paenisporosarcina sp.]|uniref:dynamin family protein n=1 Tax=Paenisporosarcina sp. TaxID=1932001 RepID=UPI003C726388
MLTKEEYINNKPIARVERYKVVLDQLSQIRGQERDLMVKQELATSGLAIRKAIDTFGFTTNDIPNRTTRILRELEDCMTKHHQLIKSLDESFMLFVVGTGKYGKSTLINSLLETEAAAVGVLPKTWKIDVFRGDIPQNKVHIKYRNNDTKIVSYEDAQLIIQEEERKRRESEKNINEELKLFKNEKPSNEKLKDKLTKLRRERLYNSEITEMHWGIVGATILEQFYVVDTPGMDQEVMGNVVKSAKEYYHKADGVIWMLDATAIAASNAKDLVEELEASLISIGEKQQNNIIAVLNRIDLIHSSGGEAAVAKIMEDASRIYGNYFRSIIPFSGKKAYEGITMNNSEIIESSGLNLLKREIHQAFYFNAKEIQYDKKLKAKTVYNRELITSLDDFSEAMNKDIVKYKHHYQRWEKLLTDETTSLIKRVKDESDQYKIRIQNNIATQMQRVFSIKNVTEQTEFIDEHILETSIFTSILNKFHEEEQKIYKNFFDHHVKNINFTEYPSLENHNSKFLHKNEIKELHSRNVSYGDDEDLVKYASAIGAGLLMSAAFGPIGLAIGGIVGFVAKHIMRSDFKQRLTHGSENMIAEIEGILLKSFKQAQQNTLNNLMRISTDSFLSVYSFNLNEDNHFSNKRLGENEVAATLTKERVSRVVDKSDKEYDVERIARETFEEIQLLIKSLNCELLPSYTPIKSFLH